MAERRPAPEMEKGEKLLREIASDRSTYWRDHGVMAALGMAVVGGILWAIGNPHVAIGALGAPLAIGARALYLASEQFSNRWWLTDRRLILPDGRRQVMLLEVEMVRRLFGDVQLVTRSGDKHLIKHVADARALATEIERARQQRAQRRKG